MTQRMLFTLAACLLIATVVAPVHAPVPTVSAQGQAPREPLDYFRVMMPVFTHDRCTNCHGGVDPVTGRDHDGGQVDAGQSCSQSGCHTQADNTNANREDDWRIAPDAVSFHKSTAGGLVKKDAKELCEQMADRVANFGDADFMHHLESDFQIDLGFVGSSGGANTGPAAAPAMDKGDFLVAAAKWMDEGFAGCDREGTITRTEEINSYTVYPPSVAGMDVVVEQTGRRDVTITFSGGRYTVRVQVTGSVTNTQTMRAVVNGRECTVIMRTHSEYADVDDPGPSINAGQTGPASVEAKVLPSGDYTILVTLPPENHKEIKSGTVEDGCGTGLQPSPREELVQEWPSYRFLIKGKLDPRDRTRLVGRKLERWFERISPDEDPWLPDHYAVVSMTGSFHPVDIKTSWNLRYRR